METKIDVNTFVKQFNELANKFDAIRNLPHVNLYQLDSISVMPGEIVFHCSEENMGYTDRETYYFPEEEINKPLAEIAQEYLDKHNREKAKHIEDKEIFEQQQIAHRKHQYEQLKKEFEK